MRNCTTLVLACLVAALAGCTSMGFDPEHDAKVARERAERPRDQTPKDLRKHDPRASLELQTNPADVEGYMVLTVPVPHLTPEFLEELDDTRRPYARVVTKKIEISKDGASISVLCKPGKPTCTDMNDAETVKVPLHRHNWRAGVYGYDGRLERIHDAVYRPVLQRFAVLLPLDEWVGALGKEVRVLSAYGDFAITRDGEPRPLKEGEVAMLPPGDPRFPVKHDDLVRMTRDEPAGKYFLRVLASEFPLPAPFHDGAAHPDLYLGAAKLTPEEGVLDCWVGHGKGTVVVSPAPPPVMAAQALGTFTVSLIRSVPTITARDCGVEKKEK